jgi:hypothetical protein
MLMASALVVAMLATAAAPADALLQATSTTAMLNQFASSRLQELNLQQVRQRPLRPPHLPTLVARNLVGLTAGARARAAGGALLPPRRRRQRLADRARDDRPFRASAPLRPPSNHAYK